MIYLLQRRWRPAGGQGPAEPPLASCRPTEKYPTFEKQPTKKLYFRIRLRTLLPVYHRLVPAECPTLGCSSVCRWSIRCVQELLTPGAAALLICQHSAVIMIKLWLLISVPSVPQTSSQHDDFKAQNTSSHQEDLTPDINVWKTSQVMRIFLALAFVCLSECF